MGGSFNIKLKLALHLPCCVYPTDVFDRNYSLLADVVRRMTMREKITISDIVLAELLCDTIVSSPVPSSRKACLAMSELCDVLLEHENMQGSDVSDTVTPSSPLVKHGSLRVKGALMWKKRNFELTSSTLKCSVRYAVHSDFCNRPLPHI